MGPDCICGTIGAPTAGPGAGTAIGAADIGGGAGIAGSAFGTAPADGSGCVGARGGA